MKCLAWNCRGIRRKDFPSNFNFICCLAKLDIFYLMDIKVAVHKVPRHFYSKYFDSIFCCDPIGQSGGLCLCWNSTKVFVSIISSLRDISIVL